MLEDSVLDISRHTRTISESQKFQEAQKFFAGKDLLPKFINSRDCFLAITISNFKKFIFFNIELHTVITFKYSSESETNIHILTYVLVLQKTLF